MRGFLIILAVAAAAFALSGCLNKNKNIIFTAVVDELHDGAILVTVVDFDGFDKALVSYGESARPGFDLIVGQRLKITALPEVRESYPVQVTAAALELLEGVERAQYQKISAETALEMIQSGGVVVLDVRTKAEYSEQRIAGAVLVPDYDITAQAPEVLPDKSAAILVYCRSGRRSQSAAHALIELGYSNVYDFGGIIDWPYETISGK